MTFRTTIMTQSNSTLNLLFVCSRNQWRSPTAETIYRKQPMLNVRSAGTASSAKRKISSSDIKWADIIIAMEEKHKNRILADYPNEARFKEIHVLHIEDHYKYMDQELIDELVQSIDPILNSN